MRIGFFTSIEGWGGSEMYLKTMILSLRQHGDEPVLIGIQGTRLFEELQAEGAECIAWKNIEAQCGGVKAEDGHYYQSRPGQSPLTNSAKIFKSALLGLLPGWVKLLAGNMREVQHLRKVFSKSKLDVIQVNVHGYEVAGIAAKLEHIKDVGFFHTSPIDEPNKARRWLIRQTGRSYHRLCFPSKYTANSWVKILHVDPELCNIVPYGIDITRFMSLVTPCRNTSDPFRLVSVGRLHAMKGYPHLIDAIYELKDERVSLDVLGEGPERGALARQISQLGLTACVRLRGHIENPEDIIKDANAFIMLSNSQESFGMAIVEAMASGLPVITSSYGPFAEINENGVTGFVVDVNNASEASKAIRTLVDDPDMCRVMGENGRQHAMDLYAKERMVLAMRKQYQKLVARIVVLRNASDQRSSP